ncbi:MAG: class II fumarate hydratase [Candidatus Micrarchaeaceae archaeon]
MYRIERDVLGKVTVPAGAYYGSETQRTVENFRVSGIKVPLELVYAYAMLKKAAAIANMKDGKLDRRRGNAITHACNDILSHKLDDQFPIDVFQSGAGTSLNMNVNEVLANRAIEILHGKLGDYSIVHPNDHVNMSQSTNDTMPSVLHIAAYINIRDVLLPSLAVLHKALAKKTVEFRDIVKIGRTHLQDAVPITLGQEFSGYESALSSSINILKDAQRRLLYIPLGGTAVGTMINADEEYAKFAVRELDRITGARFRITKNRFASMQQRLESLAVSDALKEVSTVINKIANDLRLLASGPVGGIDEITLPAVMPGSSIMPGKINPSIAEMMNMVCMTVMGKCAAISEAANGGQLEINVFTPVISYELITSIKILSNGSRIFADKCISGIEVNKDRIERNIEMDTSLATALSPYVGYRKASEIAREAYRDKKSVKQVALGMGILSKKELDRILDPRKQVGKMPKG